MASADEYRDLILKLLPRGKAWTRDSDSWAYGFAAAMAVEASRIDQRIRDLLREIDPRFSSELLSDFEREYGIPDECSVIGSDPQQRRSDLIARITAYGGQSFSYFEEVMFNAGTPITISTLAPLRAGDRSGSRVRSEGYRYIWFVEIPSVAVHYFTAGQDTAGNVLATAVDDTNVICFLEKNKPAHTYISYKFI